MIGKFKFDTIYQYQVQLTQSGLWDHHVIYPAGALDSFLAATVFRHAD